MKEKPKITKEMIVGKVVEKYPKTTFVFMEHGLYCVGCPMAQEETIEQAAESHKLDLEKLLEALNRAVK